MTEAEWLGCTKPDLMLEFLRDKPSDRKLRLFACACCRRVWHVLTDERSRTAVGLVEQLADGTVEQNVLQNVLKGPNQPRGPIAALCMREAWDAAEMAALFTAGLVLHVPPSDGSYEAERTAQCSLIRDIFGNPIRPAYLHTHRLRKNKGRTLNIAHTIYDNRAFDRLPILADALEDAGCDNADMLAHCRQPGEHVRGCWVIDLLLGKK